MISSSLPVIVSDSAVSRVANKRTLAKVSLTLERIALASAYEATVVSLFQRAEYFDRMISTYRALADAGATVITAYAGEHRDIPSVTHIPLDVDEPLADEWDLIVLTPTFGAFVVAHDLDQFDTTQARLEDGRTFAASWGFDGSAQPSSWRGCPTNSDHGCHRMLLANWRQRSCTPTRPRCPRPNEPSVGLR